MLFVPQHILDPLPTQVRLALLQDEQAGKGEQKHVTGNVESFPTKAILETRLFAQVLADIAKASVVFNT